MAISNFVSRCADGEPPVVYGDGTLTRDFTDVDDVVAANLALLSADAGDGEAVNVGSTDAVEVRTLVRAVRDRLAPDLELAYADRENAEHTRADASKARELLGYEPIYTVYEGVDAFVEWDEANRDWYAPLVRSS